MIGHYTWAFACGGFLTTNMCLEECVWDYDKTADLSHNQIKGHIMEKSVQFSLILSWKKWHFLVSKCLPHYFQSQF